MSDDLLARAREIVAAIPDPELPDVSLEELGILRGIRAEGDTVVVTITPTYTGCPAREIIAEEIRTRLRAASIAVRIEERFDPPWTTDSISEAGRAKLAAAGVAPPHEAAGELVSLRSPPKCPRCGAPGAARISEFGATPCKALYRCASCGEPFEYVKPR